MIGCFASDCPSIFCTCPKPPDCDPALDKVDVELSAKLGLNATDDELEVAVSEEVEEERKPDETLPPSPPPPTTSLCVRNAMSWATAAFNGGLPTPEEVWSVGKWVEPEDGWVGPIDEPNDE